MTIFANVTPAPDRLKICRSLLSVCDKNGLVDLAEKLDQYGVELISTGGTAQALAQAGLQVKDVSTLTDFPEIMDGRVKTLHPKVHGGLLAIRGDLAHMRAMQAHAIEAIDLLVVNLYPFEQVCRSGADFATIVENIDIGGPAMVRAGAKNHAYCAVVSDPQDYDLLIKELDKNNGQLTLDFRRQLARQAFARIAAYDVAIANWFAGELGNELPEWYGVNGTRQALMRYGENPHQKAALYVNDATCFSVARGQIIQGKALSYNNIADGDAAFELVSEFNPETQAAVAIIKHANPCGVGVGETLQSAYLKTYHCDPTSAFGGIVALNRELDEATAAEIIKLFTEVIIAPQATKAACQLLAGKPNLRLLLTGGVPDPKTKGQMVRSVAGGFLLQDRDTLTVEEMDLRVVTKRQPSESEWQDLKFAFRVVKHVKSNAIVYARDGATMGIGAGQMSRLDSARIGALKMQAGNLSAGRFVAPSETKTDLVAASDAFFPFADGLLEVAKAGAKAVIQPGGSLRDDEVIAAADAHDMAMIFTKSRHFRH